MYDNIQTKALREKKKKNKTMKFTKQTKAMK